MFWTLHRGVSCDRHILLFTTLCALLAMSVSLSVHCIPVFCSVDSDIVLLSAFLCINVAVCMRNQYMYLIIQWRPCRPIHFHGQQSIVHIGWMCIRGLYTKLLLYLFSKMLGVDI